MLIAWIGHFFVVLGTAGAGFRKTDGPPARPSEFWQSGLNPYFGNSSRYNIIVDDGRMTMLHCTVHQLGDKAVSWIRQRDLHILTVGVYTYTMDQRFQCLHDEGSDEWVLRITSPVTRDSGVYNCQINTEPKLSLSFNLTVIEPQTKIIGPSEVYLRAGSLMNLTCISSVADEMLTWYLGNKEVTTRRQTQQKASLVIKTTNKRDSGNYTCAGPLSRSSSVYVHVIIGEKPAAMQHSGCAFCGTNQSFYQLALILALALFCGTSRR